MKKKKWKDRAETFQGQLESSLATIRDMEKKFRDGAYVVNAGGSLTVPGDAGFVWCVGGTVSLGKESNVLNLTITGGIVQGITDARNVIAEDPIRVDGSDKTNRHGATVRSVSKEEFAALETESETFRKVVAEYEAQLDHAAEVACANIEIMGQKDARIEDLETRVTELELRLNPKVEICGWCPDPSNPSPEHHPNGQCEHVDRKEVEPHVEDKVFRRCGH